MSLEDLIGGRVLPWAGAVAVLLGVAFFVAVAISRGWLGEGARIALAYGGSAVLLAAGAWLYERRGRTQAALAMVGAATASGFLTTAGAVQLYALLPAAVGLCVAFAIGALSTSLALRWDSRTVAGLGTIGALAAPLLLSAGASDAGIAFVAIALACSTGVLLMRRWDWLALAVFAVSAPQLLGWAAAERSPVEIVVVVVVFWALYMVAALGHEFLVARPTVQPVPAFLSLAAPLVTAAGGYAALVLAGHSTAGDWLIAGLGAAHVGLAITARRSARLSDDIGRLLLGGGVAMGNTAWGLIADGPVVAIGWAASAVGLGALARRGRLDAGFAGMALGAQVTLSALHVLLYDAAPGATLQDLGRGDGIGALVSLAALAAASFVCARLTVERRAVRIGFDVTAMAALAWMAAFALDGPALTAAWAGQAVVIAGIARAQRDDVARYGSLAFLGLALSHTVAFDANPAALTLGGADAWAAAAGLGSLAAALLACARLLPEDSEDRGVLGGLAAAALAYLAPFMLDGAALVAVWAAGAVALAAAARLLRGLDAEIARLCAPVWLALAGLHALTIDAPPRTAWLTDERGVGGWLGFTGAEVAALIALAVVAASALASERVSRAADPLRPWLRATGFASLIYLAPFALSGWTLAAAWAAGGLALAARRERTGDEVAGAAAIACGVLGLIHVLAYEAPPRALVDGVAEVVPATLAVAALAAALLAASRLVRPRDHAAVRVALEASGATAALYAASVAIVSSFPPDGAGFDPAMTGIGVRQQAQMLLSAFWAGTGLLALVWGLLRDERSRRVGGLTLLSVALAKVFL
jgi:hypothetical protein